MNMSNLAILPIVLPLLAGTIVAFTNKKVAVSRFLSKIFILLHLGVVSWITYKVFQDGPIILEAGSWVAPYGIIFVADYLAILLVIATAILSTACIFIAPKLVSERKETFY